MALIRPTDRVCLAVGSRGIDRIAEVTAATVAAIRRVAAEVFLVPAMGSHGGATAEGQLAVLASLGVTEETVGCEIRSSMDTVRIGEVAGGIPVYLDRHAAEDADVIVPINRVKPHTDFSGPVESGLLKMIAIGLGKQLGADTFHGQGFASFAELIPEVARHTLAQANIPFGLALIENGYARLSRIEAVPAEGHVRAGAGVVGGGRAAARPTAHRRAGRAGHRPDRQGHQRPGHGLQRGRSLLHGADRPAAIHPAHRGPRPVR